MDFIEAAIFILFFASISSPIANRFHLPLEIFLVIGSCIISLIPGLPNFQLNPMIVFYLFLPPILFHGAYFTAWRDFKFNLRPISLLAFGLVIATMLLVAVIAKYLIPGFTWAEGFLLGAIVSPTDASSATAIIKKFGAPRRAITVLDGESLVNDATALILFRFALAAILGGTFSMTSALSNFVVITAGSIVLGLIICFVAVFIMKRINSVASETTFTFVIAFSCYIVGEAIGVSGVITTVVCGIYFGIRFPEIASSQTRIQAKASWNTLIFVINGFVFMLIGLKLPTLVRNLQGQSLTEIIFYGVMISIAVILIRILWMFPMAYLPRKLFPSIARRDPMPPWQMLFILSWSGMRGIVSLAAALSIPFQLSPGIAFPHRDSFLIITYCVIVMTLLIPSFSLPCLLTFFHLSESEDMMKQEALARIQALETVLEDVEKVVKQEKIPDDMFYDFKKHICGRLDIVKTQLNDMPYSTLTNEYQALKILTSSAIESERKTILKLRRSGEIHDEVFHLLSDELDLEEMRSKTLRI